MPFAAATVLLIVLGGAAATSAAATTTDPLDDPLNQSIDSGQTVATDTAVLSRGHIDLGPRIIDGTFTLLVHDDAAKADAAAQSVWRQASQTVIQLTDAALLPVPEDPAYAFLGVPAGESVSVIPQTQNPDVAWVGWNTQDPEVMDTIDRGVTLSLAGVDGPGALVVYLQSGTFGEPEVLWDSRSTEPASVWVDVNTHTHANWVFTEPGVYLAEFRIDADLVDGSTASDTQSLRFAVGDATDPQAALDASLVSTESDAAADTADAADSTADTAAEPADEASSTTVILIAVIALVALLLIVGLTFVVLRGNRAKRLALAARATR
ncbi:hypothetical protein D6T64_07000 [Cryobacterium melibiosiphilum]|uniref:Surface-anchored protein n=1 Tax=Cryobacterium melibiosiphilum TaxID=995039 RepID=A0A3A5MH28_9MICO|nr:hypothetical protein D6T64_09965 [Cryobacterium melibiosiphilum]RJT89447.1 hypothetical protein D6T64_07000 [Cryobacterium melibiosiphilum]